MQTQQCPCCPSVAPIPSQWTNTGRRLSAGELHPGLIVDEFSDIVLDEGRAVVFYTTAPALETEDDELWIVESDAWAWDDC